MRILTLDLEISPTLATVWGLFNQNVGINQIVGNSEVLCWAAKWYDEKDAMFSSVQMTTKRKMLMTIYRLLEEADVVVTYNGDAFDLKILNKEFALQGWGPPSPYKSVDMLKVMRKKFRFTSNKLGYIGPQFGLGEKTPHAGHELWLNCMNPKSSEYESSWAIMEEYNVQDVFLLEDLYTRVKGWIPAHPNYSAHENGHVCPNCSGTRLQARGYYSTASLKYKRYRCNDCGKWSRAKVAEKADRSKQLVGV